MKFVCQVVQDKNYRHGDSRFRILPSKLIDFRRVRF